MQKTLFFDLYFTLIVPAVIPGRNEWDYLGIAQPEWNAFAETEERCALADSGAIETPRALTEEIARWGNLSLSDADLDELTRRRIERFRVTLMDVDPTILQTLKILKEAGYKMCLVSNADVVDTLYWDESPLAQLMDEAVFSHRVRICKPEEGIYRHALARMRAAPEESVFIGDGGSDEHRGARRLGMRTVLTTYLRPNGRQGLERRLPYADAVIDNFADLPKVLETL